MNKIIKMLLFLLTIFVFCSTVQGKVIPQKEIYENQLKMSGAENLTQALPKKTMNTLEKIGLKNINPESIAKIDIQKIFDEATSESREKFKNIFSHTAVVIGILLICAIFKNFCPQKNENHLNSIINSVCCLGLCKFIIYPILQCIAQSRLIIENAGNFATALSAVMIGILISLGKPISASSYHYLVLVAGKIIEKIFSKVIITVLTAIFGTSVIMSVSQQSHLEEFCKTAHKTLQSFLKFVSASFVGILTLQNLITSSADKISISSAKLMINGFVPIVGGAISDAFETVRGYLNLLKSTVGAFGIIAGVAIFFPIVTECALWVVFLHLCKFLSDTLDLKKQSLLFKSIVETMKTLVAILISTVVILISSTGIILMMGG